MAESTSKEGTSASGAAMGTGAGEDVLPIEGARALAEAELESEEEGEGEGTSRVFMSKHDVVGRRRMLVQLKGRVGELLRAVSTGEEQGEEGVRGESGETGKRGEGKERGEEQGNGMGRTTALRSIALLVQCSADVKLVHEALALASCSARLLSWSEIVYLVLYLSFAAR